MRGLDLTCEQHCLPGAYEQHDSERNHQGLDSALIDPGPEADQQEGRILCRPRLGGLLRHYVREIGSHAAARLFEHSSQMA